MSILNVALDFEKKNLACANQNSYESQILVLELSLRQLPDKESAF